MTTRQADKLIAKGTRVRVRNAHFDETFEAVFVRRGRFNIESAAGGLFERADLVVVEVLESAK